jgi:site-specific DNA recombinase
VIGYGRFSEGPDQERSTAQQRADLERRAQVEGWQIIGWFEDNARSGLSTDGRDQFQAMVDRCLEHPDEVDAVVMWEFSRFARNEADSGYFLGMLERLGIAVVSMNEPLPNSPAASIVRAAYLFMAAEESRKIALRVSRGHLASLRQGFSFGSRPPAGYKAERVEAGRKVNGETRYSVRWVPDPEMAPSVRQAFRMYADGYSIAQIHEVTHVQKSMPAYTWTFGNPTYIGTLRYGENEFPGAIEALIDAETWERAQARRSARIPPRRQHSPYLLSGLVCCGLCGRPMNGKSMARYHYYACIQRYLKPWEPCPARMVRAEQLEQEIILRLLARLSPDNVNAVAGEIQLQMASAGPARQQAKAAADIARAERAIANLCLAVEEGSTAARKQLVERERELAELQAKKDRLAAGLEEVAAPPEVDREAVLAVLADWSQGLREGDLEEKRAILRRAVERIKVADGRIDVFYRPVVR